MSKPGVGRILSIAVGIALLVGLWIAAPEIFTGTVSDLDTFLRVAALVVGLGLWVWGIRRFVRPPALSMIVALVPVVVVVATVVWPYLRPATSVDEAFPTVIAAPETPSDTAPVDELAPTTTVSPNSAPTDTLGVTEPGEVINETDPSSSESIADTSEKDGATATTTVPAADGEPDPASASTTTPASTTTASTTTSTTTAPTTVPTGPVLLRSAGFQGLTGHNGSGNAALYRLADNSILLRFESVNIGPGPALHVYLVPGADQRALQGATYVAPLTAQKGNQNYEVPAGIDLTVGTWTVLVWCDTFTVEVANATF